MPTELKDRYLLAALLCLILLLHWQAAGAGFVTDFTGLWSKMQGQGLSAALQSFGFPSLMPLLNVFYLYAYQLFGLNGYLWLSTFALFYATGLLFFYKAILLLVNNPSKTIIALATVGLVIVSPYQVEAMIWKVGLGHIASVSFFLIAFYAGLKYLKEPSLKLLIYMVVFQIASLFCFEWALVFPIFIAVLGYQLSSKKFWSVLLVSGAVSLCYLLLTKLFIGKAIGHYNVPLDQLIDVMALSGNTYKYLIKHLFLVHFLPYKIKELVYGWGDLTAVRLGVVVLVILAGWIVIKAKDLQIRKMFSTFLASLVGLVLVLPLYFSYIQLSENNRYGSLFVPFLSLFLVLLVSRLPRKFAIGVYLCYFVINLVLHQKLVRHWAHTENVVSGLVKTYPSDLEGPILMLNLPENVEGAFMFRNFSEGNPFVDHMAMYGYDIPESDLVAQFNRPASGQASTAKWLESGQMIELEHKYYGSWWWRSGIGVSNYSTEKYKVTFKGKKMEVVIKDTSYYKHIIYADDAKWKILK